MCTGLQCTNIVSDTQNDTRNATARHDVDPLQTTLLGKLLQLFWLVPSLVLILSLNCLFLVAILRTKKLWRPRFVLPASLCVLDIVQGSLFIPSSVVNIVMGGNNNPAWFCWIQASYLYVGAIELFPTNCTKLQGPTNDMQNDTRNATVRHDVDPLHTTLLGKLLQLFWLVPSLVLILSLNCLFLVAILRTKKLWRPRFVLPASLCVLDIVQGSLFIPSSVVNIVIGGNNNTAWFCWTQAGYFYVGACCTLSTLTLMAWDRYQAVCNALHYQEKLDLPRLLTKIAAAWTCSLALSLGYIISMYRKTDDCKIDAPFCTLPELSNHGHSEKRFFIIWVVCELICIAVICLSYGKVYLETKGYQRRQRQFVSHRRSDSSQRNKRTERTISAQVTILFVFLIIRYIQIGISLLVTSEDKRISVLIVKRTVQFLYLTVPCFSNPVIYGLSSKELQTAVRNVCCGKPANDGSPLTRRRNVVKMSRSRSVQQDSERPVHTRDIRSPSFIRSSTFSRETCDSLTQDEDVSCNREGRPFQGEDNAGFGETTSSF
ncbi:olfactory receptor 8-like [Branchiostoma floridae]|uniref:Olfactory receptor 8-like n=1 Tax=Branchiostoma floridae TaxID=7739 RepID=A0A9J7MDJ3_BRAFL|nr:olfactory receptor 8-like [Branchiostoma floridae]